MGSNLNQLCASFEEEEADNTGRTSSKGGLEDHLQTAEVPQHEILEVKIPNQPNHAVPKEAVRVHRHLDVLRGRVQDLAVPAVHHHLQRGVPQRGGVQDLAVQDSPYHHLQRGVLKGEVRELAAQDDPHHLQRDEEGRRGHADPDTATVAILCQCTVGC